MSNTRTGYTGGNGRNPKGPRGLGPDVVVFPGQPIFVHTTAYDDEALGDDVGTVTSAAPQEQNSYIQRTSHYTLTWLVSPVGSVGPATLTPEALAQLRAYTANSGAQCGSGPILLRQRAPIECEPSTQGAVLGGKPMR